MTCFRFRDFLGSVEGYTLGVAARSIPLVVPIHPHASSASNLSFEDSPALKRPAMDIAAIARGFGVAAERGRHGGRL